MDCDNLLFLELPPGGKNIAKGGLAKPFAQVSPCKFGWQMSMEAENVWFREKNKTNQTEKNPHFVDQTYSVTFISESLHC